jgi:exonuclease-1
MCIKIHSAFANAVAKGLMKAFARDSRFNCIFSPYEADAQLAKLCVDGIANAIITEDSDVLVYSATCHISIPIIYKLDRTSGDCDVVNMDWLICATNENRPLQP